MTAFIPTVTGHYYEGDVLVLQTLSGDPEDDILVYRDEDNTKMRTRKSWG
jgi:hypothetical protein